MVDHKVVVSNLIYIMEQQSYRSKPGFKKYQQEYRLEQQLKSPKYKINIQVARAIRHSLKGYTKSGKWELLVGYTLEDLQKHLKKQFKSGMTLDNYGDWHLDHIIPKSHFNFDSLEDIDFKRCWALDNIQPLWAMDNLRKQTKLDAPFQPSFAF